MWTRVRDVGTKILNLILKSIYPLMAIIVMMGLIFNILSYVSHTTTTLALTQALADTVKIDYRFKWSVSSTFSKGI